MIAIKYYPTALEEIFPAAIHERVMQFPQEIALPGDVLVIIHSAKNRPEYCTLLETLERDDLLTKDQIDKYLWDPLTRPWTVFGVFFHIRDPSPIFVKHDSPPVSVFHELFHAHYFLAETVPNNFTNEFLSEYNALTYWLQGSGELLNAEQHLNESIISPANFMVEFRKLVDPMIRARSARNEILLCPVYEFSNPYFALFLANWRFLARARHDCTTMAGAWGECMEVIANDDIMANERQAWMQLRDLFIEGDIRDEQQLSAACQKIQDEYYSKC